MSKLNPFSKGFDKKYFDEFMKAAKK